MRIYDGIMLRINNGDSVTKKFLRMTVVGRSSTPLVDKAIEVVKALLPANSFVTIEFFPHQKGAGDIYNVTNGILNSLYQLERREDNLMTQVFPDWHGDFDRCIAECCLAAHRKCGLDDKAGFEVQVKQELEQAWIYPTQDELNRVKRLLYYENPIAFGYLVR